MGAKKSSGTTRKRPVHVVSSGQARRNPATGLQKTTPAKPAPKKTTTPKKRAQGAGEAFASKRRGDLATRKRSAEWERQAREQSHSGSKGITRASIQRDGTLNATEKKKMIAILDKAKSEG